ncbi:hypothetical protein [Kiloniella sp.]|uniref:hypothetical protein n=1 Tax=Kiloniella sp. TaxID=1938587 RepID=UPI003B01B470
MKSGSKIPNPLLRLRLIMTFYGALLSYLLGFVVSSLFDGSLSIDFWLFTSVTDLALFGSALAFWCVLFNVVIFAEKGIFVTILSQKIARLAIATLFILLAIVYGLTAYFTSDYNSQSYLPAILLSGALSGALVLPHFLNRDSYSPVHVFIGGIIASLFALACFTLLYALGITQENLPDQDLPFTQLLHASEITFADQILPMALLTTKIWLVIAFPLGGFFAWLAHFYLYQRPEGK